MLSSVSQTTYWDYFHSILAGVRHFSTREDNKQIRLTESYSFLCFILLGNKAFDFKKVFCSLLNLPATEFTFNQCILPVSKM